MKIEKLLPLWLIGLYPLALIIGTLISEIINVLLIILFLYSSIINKKPIKLDDKIIYLLLIIWIYLIINLITSIDFKLSFNRSIFFIRYPLLIMSMCYFFSKYEENLSIVFKMWMVTLLLTIFDLYFQFFSGENLLGYKSPWEQRLSGFFNEELKVAHLLIGFFLPSFAFFFQKNPKRISLYVIFVSYLIILILTNERANIIRGSFVIFGFFVLMPNIKAKIKFFLILIFISIISLNLIFVDQINQRFVKEIKNMANNENINKPFDYIIFSNYGPHYLASFEIFKQNLLFGTGTKTFRKACKNVSIEKYYGNTNFEYTKCTTHPHQHNFEILSELGAIGYSLFFTFFIYLMYRVINTFIKTKNLVLLSSSLFFVSQLIPLIPTGSFFTSFGSTIFFINISLIYYYIKKYE